MDYVTGLLISMDWNGTSYDSNGIAYSTNWEGTSYNSILVVVDLLTPVTTRMGLPMSIG